MLVDARFKANDVVSFKLVTGEEVISRFDAQTDTQYKIKNPMVVLAGPHGLGMQPFMFSVDPDNIFPLNMSNVICAMGTEQELAKQYITQTSGIQLV